MTTKDGGNCDTLVPSTNGGEVDVIYLNVQSSDGTQVLDISSLLVQEDIQLIETSSATDQLNPDHTDNQNNTSGSQVVINLGKSEAQSAHALLNLSKAQAENDSSCLQVSDILAAHRLTQEDQNANSAEALLQLSSDQNSSTYIVDENGSMIALEHVSSSNLIDVDDTGVTTIAICQCWCGRDFISQEDLERHKLAHKYQRQARSDSNQNKCDLCSEIFNSSKDLCDHHFELHSSEMVWDCEVCHRKFFKKIALKAHMRVHSTLTRYQCSTCKKIFFYKTALNRHLKVHTCEKPFKCTICGDLYQTLWDLRKHRLNHQPARLYKCDICTKVFKQKQTLFVHSRLHSGHRPYSCDVCRRTFSLKTTLIQHQRIHTGEKPNVCPTCHRAFRQNSTLKAHMRTHTNLKPYICRYCKMRFAYQDELQDHEHSHARNKNWQCDKCGMWFKNQSLLLRHCRVHTNERPFQCTICYKTFVQSGSLQAHMRSHTKEKPYNCRLCSKSYYTSGTLLIHIRKAHNVEARSVKEIFPVVKCVEDQKVFTVRNKLMMDNQPITTEMLVKKEPAQTSEELMINTLSEDLLSRYHLEGETVHIEVQQIEVGCSDEIVKSLIDNQECVSVGSFQHGLAQEDERREQVENITIKIEADALTHTAEDRQEAALGLAELSLAGEGLVGEKPTKTKTFFKEEEEDENDPNLTKIILSKEGGIMNSQDPHQCPVCGRIFGRKSIMTEHLRIHTDEKPYQCDFCKAGFRQNAQLRSHIRNKHTKVERYQCSFCHKRFLSRSITVRHINFHHKLKVKYCESVDSDWSIDIAVWFDDNFEFNTSETLFVKANKKKGDKLLKVSSPNSSSFSEKKQLAESTFTKPIKEKKVKENSPSSLHRTTKTCPVGPHTQTSPAAGGQTKSSDTDDNPDLGVSKLLCGSCAMQFPSLSNLHTHLLEVHKTTLDKTDLSLVYEETETTKSQQDDATMKKDNFIIEMDTAVEELSSQDKAPLKIIVFDDTQMCADDPQVMPYACFMCSMRYTNKADLHEHMRSHSDGDVERVGLHRCDTCLFVMKNTQQVAKHILKFHGIQEIFICSICYREFFQSSSVYRHMRFFHKWEIKIRGECNIPVLVKPASPSQNTKKELVSATLCGEETADCGRMNFEIKKQDVGMTARSGQNVAPFAGATSKNTGDDTSTCNERNNIAPAQDYIVHISNNNIEERKDNCQEPELQHNQLLTLNMAKHEVTTHISKLDAASVLTQLDLVSPVSKSQIICDSESPIIMSVRDISRDIEHNNLQTSSDTNTQCNVDKNVSLHNPPAVLTENHNDVTVKNQSKTSFKTQKLSPAKNNGKSIAHKKIFQKNSNGSGKKLIQKNSTVSNPADNQIIQTVRESTKKTPVKSVQDNCITSSPFKAASCKDTAEYKQLGKKHNSCQKSPLDLNSVPPIVRSSSGRIIKKKHFDDEIMETKTVQKKRKT
ncbi:hypothetical protein Btru_062024 [Bulinus truncatus]|nr:hypothetical protein Btru_062024 [Bulinus truncatus]